MPASQPDSRCMVSPYRGKSGLHRAKRQLTTGGREPTESATENIPPSPCWVRVKWCGKSAPRRWQQRRHGKPRLKQDQIGIL